MTPDTAVELQRTPAVILVVDLVESVALMERNETASIARWRALRDRALDELPLRYAGRVVKSTGDGLLAQFRLARRGAEAARWLHQAAEELGRGASDAEPLRLRVGIHQGSVFADEVDLYGRDVNLASRVMSLAGPGETVVTLPVRDALVDQLDGQLEDLGECHLKHVQHPVRAYRLGPAGAAPRLPARHTYGAPFRAGVAVLPFSMRIGDASDHAIGELVADALIVQLGRGRQLRVISRLSTTALRDRGLSAEQLRDHLGAQYLLGGSYVRQGAALSLFWELTDLRSNQVLHSALVPCSVGDLFDPASAVATAIAAEAQEAILKTELRRVQMQPMPTLESFTLLLGAVRLLHRRTPADIQRSHELLQFLTEQHPLAVEPRIWMAKWYAMRAVQGQASDRQADARIALGCTRRALDRDPENSLALAMEGFVHCHLTHDYLAADRCFDQALALNPSESFAHLFRGVTLGIASRFDEGLAASMHASDLSPLDPARYLFDTIAAYLALGGAHLPQAIDLARRSLRANREHAHSWRVLAIAQSESGDMDAAREALLHVRRLQPELTVGRYLADRADDPARRRFADALARAGLPLS